MAADRQLAGNDRPFLVYLGSKRVSNAADDDLGCPGAHAAGGADPLPQPFDEQPAIRVEHHLDDRRVVERGAELVAQRFLQFADERGCERS